MASTAPRPQDRHREAVQPRASARIESIRGFDRGVKKPHITKEEVWTVMTIECSAVLALAN